MSVSDWGRVDESGAVYVRTADGERLVGEYPDATPEEALAYFVRKFTDLEGQVTLLEARARGGAPAQDIAKAAKRLSANVEQANAVGDLASLAARLQVLHGEIEQLSEEQTAQQRAAVEEAVAHRTTIVEQAEAIAARDLACVQWNRLTAEFDALFAAWKEHQATGPRLPKKTADELWARFRQAKSKVDSARRAFYHDLDASQREAKAAKERLIERAEALEAKGADGIPAYRALLDEWKTVGRAGKRSVDDQLWARFKAAGDALYGAKAEAAAREDEEYQANLEAKLAIVAEAEQLLDVQDHHSARDRLREIQRRFEAAGRVPRAHVKTVEDRMRRVEQHVKKLADEHWKRTDPSRKERSEGFAGQLEASIEKLERELEEAKAAGDRKAIELAEQTLEAQRTWLAAVRRG